ncbi:uncharacterized protein MICPUCDRAFT_20381 [Micromonas pusilla CCMP1545]|uniref:Predicted protein n=1 Tax=Micromonas pusilla (strain CCMP1545) TaxID=564608 RepID=C1N0U4_MICPC|nr:uncharacterized protein MICPUCDRAFT_20381 [Micromonas pusilla CCMP1545]EEH54083.1 predicted protein [Micromonas pusilla CCMP1545]|eukprot:XP_003061453.1 predicted protein [Micromonas pusilla CCMP1545]
MARGKLDAFASNVVERHAVGPRDVRFDVKYCGVCHTDVHFVKDDMNLGLSYPLTPGHELAGVVVAVGDDVTKLRPGDNVSVGCVVDSCFGCRACADLEEQYCSNGMVGTYGSITKYGRHGPNGAQTHGGYSDAFVVNERFAFKLPRGVDLAKAAPLLCAGITTYDPLVKLGCGLPASGRPEPKKRVGIVGLGGLGGVGVKIAKSFGCDVVAFSSTAAKRDDAFAIGASDFVLNTDAERMKALAKEATFRGLDVILDTLPAPHDLQPYVDLLSPDGALVVIGLTGDAASTIVPSSLVFSRKVLRGSLIGGTRATKEMLEHCVTREIFPDVEVIDASGISDAVKKLDAKNDKIRRYVIDCSTIPKSATSPG